MVNIIDSFTNLSKNIFKIKPNIMSKYIIALLFSLPYTSFAQLYSNASNQLPSEGTQGSSMDVRAADLDKDGDLDIVLANEFQANTILINDGTGVFMNGTMNNLPQETHDSEDVTIADFNKDGSLDLVFCSEDDVTIGWSNVHEYYLGDGNGHFNKSEFQLPDSEANAVISADLNGDGFVDLIFGNNGPNSLLLNNGSGIFELAEDRLPQLNKTTQDLALADVDGDGDLDLFEGNENGNILLINDGNGYFSDQTNTHLPQGLNIETRKVSFADIDGDNDLVIFLSNVEFIPGKDRQNRLFVNDGNGVFSDATASNLPSDNDYTIDGIFEDIDLDEDLDLIICNIGGGPVKVYENDGNGIFTNNTIPILGQFYYRDALGVIANDFNGDGLNDLYICDRKNPNTNNKDLLLIRNSIISSQVTPSIQEQDIKVFPNPGNDIFTIQMENKIPEMILVTNTEGQLLKAIDTIPNDTLSIDLSTFPGGAYLVIAQYEDKQQILRKLVKE